jgi:hypothetical protein
MIAERKGWRNRTVMRKINFCNEDVVIVSAVRTPFSKFDTVRGTGIALMIRPKTSVMVGITPVI